MLIIFIITIFGSIFLSVLSASLCWKHYNQKLIGFIPIVMMIPIGLGMLLIFELYRPVFLTLQQYVASLYALCLLYFVIQFLYILKKQTHNYK